MLGLLPGDDFPIKTIIYGIYGFRSLVEVVMKFTQLYDPLENPLENSPAAHPSSRACAPTCRPAPGSAPALSRCPTPRATRHPADTRGDGSEAS